MRTLTHLQIARIVHEANRALCTELGDQSQPPFDRAPDWQIDSAVNGIEGIAFGTIRTPEDSHKSWLAQKFAEGWVLGPVKNPETKEHPCMVPYDQLPPEQQLKDHLFFAIVRAMLGLPADPLRIPLEQLKAQMDAESNDPLVSGAPGWPVKASG